MTSVLNMLAHELRTNPEGARAIAAELAPLLTDLLAASSKPGWLDAKDAAEYLGVHVDTLNRQARAGRIPSEQEAPGCKRFFNRSDLDRLRESGGAPIQPRRGA